MSEADLRAQLARNDAWFDEVCKRLCAAAGVDVASLFSEEPSIEDMEAAFSGERQRGEIPDDRLITARLSELEVART